MAGIPQSHDKKTKLQEQLKTIKLLFKRLRLIYDKCNENCQGMEYTHIEVIEIYSAFEGLLNLGPPFLTKY